MQPKLIKRHLSAFSRTLLFVVVLLALVGTTVSSAFAMDTGYFSPTKASSPQGKNWTSVSYTFVSDDFYAVSKKTNKQLKLYNFTLPGIPGGSTINGIEVAVEGHTSGLQANVALSFNGGSTFTTPYTTTLLATDTTVVLGGPANTWGRAWLPGEFTNTNFMMKLTTTGSGGPIYIDQVQVKVYITPPPATLVLSPVSGPFAGSASMTATLTVTNGGGALGSRDIKFYVGGNGIDSSGNCTGTLVGNTNTNPEGVAVLASASLISIANAGTYPYGACAQFAGDPAYSGTSITSSLTVTGTDTQLVVSPVTGPYGGTVSLSATLTHGGTAIPNEWITFSLFGNDLSAAKTNGSGVATLANVSLVGYNAGTSNDVGASFAGDGNYSPTTGTAQITISQRPITVTAVTDAKTYDGTVSSTGIPQITTGSLITGDTAAFTQAFNTKDVGISNKAITPAGIVEDDNFGANYTVTFVPVSTGTINKASLIAQADNKKIFVTRPDPIFTVTYTGLKGTDTGADIDTKPTCSVSVAHTAVGTYPIACSGAVDNNYNITSYLNGILTVVPPTFADVPASYWAWEYVERVYAAGITGGCTLSPLNYCPGNSVTRAQMAIFLLRAEHGSNYTPPAAIGMFADVPASNPAAPWIEQLAKEGITGGCTTIPLNYCPNNAVTRAQMAIFLLRAEHGSAYVPPAATGMFLDVPVGSSTAPWIERLANEQITGGCGGGNYCPSKSVTRDQMAIFLTRTFKLPDL